MLHLLIMFVPGIAKFVTKNSGNCINHAFTGAINTINPACKLFMSKHKVKTKAGIHMLSC